MVSGDVAEGSPILWVSGPDGKPRSVASNAPDPDGIVIFRVNANGTLSDPSFQDGGGGSPFCIAFLHNRPDTFILAYAVGDGVSMCRIDEDGRIGVDKVVPINTRRGAPIPRGGLYSSRRWDEMIYRAELAQLAEDDATLRIALTFTREPPQEWTGFRRRIDRMMLAEVAWPPSERPRVFVCGPTSLVEAAAAALVDLGHDPALVKTERFGPTGG